MSGYTNNGDYTISANAPVAADRSVAVTKDTPITFDALTTTTDADAGNTITLERAFYAADHGRCEIDPANGQFTYEPDPDYTGTDLLRGFVYDGAGNFDTLHIPITVT